MQNEIATTDRIRILIVEDHHRFRAALRRLLELEVDLHIVGEATDGPEAIDLACQLKPQVICMDLRLPTFTGVEATRRLLGMHPTLKIIGLSAHSEKSYITEMLEAGAVAYVSKADVCDELVHAIRDACRIPAATMAHLSTS
ncbi:hypothetical protein BH11PSE11_BH11PSE11_20770 [soil metagenome]